MLSSFLMISSAYLHSTTMLLTEFSCCDDDDHMTITHILTTPTVELSPVAAMYVDPMVLIFSTLLNLGLISS